MQPDKPTVSVYDTAQFAGAAATTLAHELATAVRERGRATLAVSGGRTPLEAFARLATAPLPWHAIDVLQVDERCTPAGHEERNAVQLERAFHVLADERPQRFHWLPLDDSPDPRAAARTYSATLETLAGSPPTIDVLQLGLGGDGHTASLFPGEALELVTPSVGFVSPAAGWPRVTLTLTAINAARRILWLVAGPDKRQALRGLVAGDPRVVGSQVRRSGATILADRAAAGGSPDTHER